MVKGMFIEDAMKVSLIVILSIFLLIILAFPCDAKIYKWLDDEGVWNFTDDYQKVPEKYRDVVKEMETKEERQYEIHLNISGQEVKEQTAIEETREETIIPEEVSRKTARKAYVPGLGWFIEEINLGPGDVVTGDVVIYIDGKRFRLLNEKGIEAEDLNFRDKENMKKVYLPKALAPTWIIYGGKETKKNHYKINPQLEGKSGLEVMRELMKNRVYRHLY